MNRTASTNEIQYSRRKKAASSANSKLITVSFNKPKAVKCYEKLQLHLKHKPWLVEDFCSVRCGFFIQTETNMLFLETVKPVQDTTESKNQRNCLNTAISSGPAPSANFHRSENPKAGTSTTLLTSDPKWRWRTTDAFRNLL